MGKRQWILVVVAVIAGGGIRSRAIASPFAYFNRGLDTGALYVFDTAANSVVASIPIGTQARGVAVNPNGSRVYVTSPDDATLAAIDTFTNSVVATIPVGLGAFGVAVNPASTRAYVTNQFSCSGPPGDSVSVVDTATNTVVAEVSVGTRPKGIVVTPDGTRVYVANNCGDTTCGSCASSTVNTLSVIDTATNTVTETLSGVPNPGGLAIAPDGKRLYVAAALLVAVLDTATNSVIGTVPLPDDVFGIAINPTGTRVYATVQTGPTSVAVIDTSSNTLTATVSLPNSENTSGLSVTPDGTHVYVANTYTNVVSVIDTSSNTLVASVPVGDGIAYAFGEFIGPAFTCGNGIVEPGEQCDDGNLAGGDGCSAACAIETCYHCSGGGAGSCSQSSAGTACADDGNACTDDLCDAAGACTHPNIPAGTICPDDGNVCTDDQCDGGGNCVHTNNAAPCDDGNACTRADACSGGNCVGTDPIDCSVLSQCHGPGTCDQSSGQCAFCPVGYIIGGGGCQKTYSIDASLLDNLSYFCDGTGANRFNGCNGAFGFHWTDAGDASVGPVIAADLRLEAGISCEPRVRTVLLNGNPVGTYGSAGKCSCDSMHEARSLPGIDIGSYLKSGENAILTDDPLDCEGLSEDSDGFYAVVTVTYQEPPAPTLPDGSNCDDGVFCNGDDTCTGGNCTEHSGDPCLSGSECQNTCNESQHTCLSPHGASCADDSNPCTVDQCDGAGVCAHSPGNAGSVCRPAVDACDVPESCTGMDAECPADVNPSCTPLDSRTPTVTVTPTPSASVTDTPTNSAAPTASETATVRPTATPTATSPATVTQTPAAMPTKTQTSVATPTATDTATATPPIPTATDSPAPPTHTPVVGCPPTPAGSCVGSTKSTFTLNHSSNPTRDKLSWKLRSGGTVLPADLGDPTSSADYTLCVYGNSALLFAATMPHGGLWRAKGSPPSGYQYADPLALHDGVTGARVASGTAGRTKAQVAGKGANLPVVSLPLAANQLPVTVQMRNSVTLGCWSGTYSNASKNDAAKLVLKVP